MTLNVFDGFQPTVIFIFIETQYVIFGQQEPL